MKDNNGRKVKTLSLKETKVLISQIEKSLRNFYQDRGGEQFNLNIESAMGALSGLMRDIGIDDSGLMHLDIDVKNSDISVNPSQKNSKAFVPYSGKMDVKIKEYTAENQQAKCSIFKAENMNPSSSLAKFTFASLEIELIFIVLSRIFPTVTIFVEKEKIAKGDIYKIMEIVNVTGDKVKSDLFADKICDVCPISKQLVIDSIGPDK